MAEECARYEQIKQAIKASIESGDLPEGAPVPSERELTVTYDITRNQTRQALRELEIEGYIERSQGRRSVVAAPALRARPLVMSGKPTLAIAMQDQQTLHSQHIMQGLMHAASNAGFQTVAYNLHFDLEGERDFLQFIRTAGVSGLAFWSHFDQPETRDILVACQRSNFPVVLIDRFLEGLEMDAVVTDNVAAGRALTRKLLERGHERIGFITEEEVSTSARERFIGCCQAHSDVGRSFDHALHAMIEPGADTPAGVVRILQSRKDRPTAYVCTHDRLARAVGRELMRLGYDIPGDVELATLEDDQCADNENLPMWVLRQPSRDIGLQAFSLLVAREAAPEKPAEIRRLAPRPDAPILAGSGNRE